jgi:hypothetical protein
MNKGFALVSDEIRVKSDEAGQVSNNIGHAALEKAVRSGKVKAVFEESE